MRHYEGIRSHAELPWLVTMDGRLSGFLGPVFLLAPVGLLALGRREGRQVLMAAAVFGSTYFMNYGARFLMPAAVFLALAMAMANSSDQRHRRSAPNRPRRFTFGHKGELKRGLLGARRTS
jgi:hypothetical protein